MAELMGYTIIQRSSSGSSMLAAEMYGWTNVTKGRSDVKLID